jgi:hypothetical protein
MTKQSNQNIRKVTTKNFNDFVLSNDSLVYTPTGEIISNYSFMIEYHKLSKKLHRSSDAFYVNTWNKFMKFTKLYTLKMSQKLPEMSVSAKALFLTLITYVESNTDVVVINESYFPSNKELSDISRVSINKINKTLEELEMLELIKLDKQQSSKNKIMVVNPNYAFNGKNILKRTLSFFKI